MTAWLLAAVAGVAVGLLGYLPAFRGRRVLAWLAGARAVAVALVAAVALGAPVRGAPNAGPLVALDASASRTRALDAAGRRTFADSARRLASARGASVVAFGESVRVATVDGVGTAPADRASRTQALADSAAAAGRVLVVVTDGEVDDPESLARAPAGSRVVLAAPPRGADAAVVQVDAPTAAAPGDTLSVGVTVAADAAGSSAGRVAVQLDDRAPTAAPVPALGPYGRTTATVRLPVAPDARAHTALLHASVTTAADREPRNDTLVRAVDVTTAPRAVVVSTAPDYDVGVALSVLRGALAVPARAYYRVAPGAWRVAGTLAPASEADVRAAAAGASLLVLHGDTTALGAPRTLGRAGLALVPVGDAGDSTADWYAGPGSTTGPLASLVGIVWDTLPPIDVATNASDATAATAGLRDRWTGVVARVGRRGSARAVIAGGISPTGRRVAVVAGGGFWRWSFRGGAAAGAAQALWGAVFDYLADAPPVTSRALTPVDATVRAGDSVRWRGTPVAGASPTVRLTHRGVGRSVTLALVSADEPGTWRSDSPPPGVYDVEGGAVLVVNASSELLPRRPRLVGGPVGAGARDAGSPVAPLSPGWPLAAATLLLCAEWVVRRRLGLR